MKIQKSGHTHTHTHEVIDEAQMKMERGNRQSGREESKEGR